ncbi:MAG: hypothetical protein LBG71_05990 [Clostridiales Family XIII bacterium]|jgi:hypothetical protein|nr:hypothetical protein [Clostridiales Family XIII bacterium]
MAGGQANQRFDFDRAAELQKNLKNEIASVMEALDRARALVEGCRAWWKGGSEDAFIKNFERTSKDAGKTLTKWLEGSAKELGGVAAVKKEQEGDLKKVLGARTPAPKADIGGAGAAKASVPLAFSPVGAAGAVAAGGGAIEYGGPLPELSRNDFLTGLMSALDDNVAFGASKLLQGWLDGYPHKDQYDDAKKYYEGRLLGDALSAALATGATAAGIVEIIGAVGAGGAVTVGTGGTLAVGGVAVATGGATAGAAMTAGGAASLALAQGNWGRDAEKLREAKESAKGIENAKDNAKPYSGYRSPSDDFTNSKGNSTLTRHFSDHGKDFGYSNERQYLEGARNFLEKPTTSTTQSFISNDGWYFRYDTATNEFGIMNKYGSVSTYFKPNTGIEYWMEEVVNKYAPK